MEVHTHAAVIPPFLAAVDNARSFLAPDGLLGVCDFYTAQKYEDKPVKMSWARRFFWRATFDIDGIDVGPERRMYLHHVLSTVHESTSQVRSSMLLACCTYPCPGLHPLCAVAASAILCVGGQSSLTTRVSFIHIGVFTDR